MLHHQAETIFKAFGRALRMAVAKDPRMAGHNAVYQRQPIMPGIAASTVVSPTITEERFMTIAVIDYQMGNTTLSVGESALEHITRENVIITRDPRTYSRCNAPISSHGAIRDCVGGLGRTELRGLVDDILTRQS